MRPRYISRRGSSCLRPVCIFLCAGRQGESQDTFGRQECRLGEKRTKYVVTLPMHSLTSANDLVRPSTGTADQKESMQLQFARMEGLWPAESDLPGFRTKAEVIMKQVQQ